MRDQDLQLLLARPGGAPVLQGPLHADRLEGEGPPGEEPDYLWEEGGDPNALPEQRWGLIAPQGERGDRLLALVQPLIEHRHHQQGALPQIFRAPSRLTPAEALRWRKRVFEAGAGLRSELPRYLLLLGDLDVLPLSLEHAFAGDAFPGRLCFPTDAGYQSYVAKLLRWERAREAARGEAVLCGVRDGTPATELGERALLGPGFDLLEESCRNGNLDATIARLDLGADPSPDPLLARAAVADRPTVLFTVSHGEGPPPGGWTVDADARARQGAMCLGRHALTAVDLATRPFLPGGAWCMLACYSAGTPEASAYHRWLAALAATGRYKGHPDAVLDALPKPGARPFIAALAQAVLANPEGPLAFVGHVDLAWTYGFQNLDDRSVSRPSRLTALVRSALRGNRVGVGMRELARGVNMANAELTSLFDRNPETGSWEQAHRAHLWLLRQDLSTYILLGDPAARLAIAGGDVPASARQEQTQVQQTVNVAAADQGHTGFLGVPFESVRGVTRSTPIEQVYLNVWFPKFEPRAPRFVVDVPIEMRVALGPQRHGAPTDPLSEDLLGRLRRLSQIDVWVQCADADVTPCDGTLHLPWPTNVLSFELTPRRPGGLRIVVVLLIHNQPVHRLEREVQVQDRRDRGERWG